MNNLVKSSIKAIPEILERLRALSQVSVQEGWRYYDGDLPVAEALDCDRWSTWTLSEVNERDHHPWIKGRKVRWFSRIIQVPHALQGYPLEGLCLRLALLWWAEEAQVYVNGQLVQEGDLFDCAPRLLLSQQVAPGEEFAIALRFVSPIHDNGALMKSVCQYEALNGLPEPSFIANEVAVLHSYLTTFQPEKLDILAQALSQLEWSALTTSSPLPSFTQSLAELRQTLLPLASPLKQRQIRLLGHAHLDMAWLWAVEETWRAAERTFQSVLNLQKDFSALTFAHSTPALYEWIEQNRPELFAQIQAQVTAGKWEIVAGFWIEPELNLINGESIVRQVLYGQRYIQEKFGKLCAIAWVPDTFGFTWQLPQILKQGGVEYFVTQKLRWNDTTKFPYEVFFWQAPDGTQVLSFMSAPIGEFIDPIKMSNFAWEWEQKTGIQTTLWLPGVGDHGGGPTRDMLEVAQRWEQSPFFPELKFGTAHEYFEELKAKGSEQETKDRKDGESEDKRFFPEPSNSISHPQLSSFPNWNSELYLEYHRGCYTTHADQKKANRRSEVMLYQAELWASLAAIAVGTPYPKADIETAWKKTLFNQFHDILPGSSITPVFVEANQTWKEVEQSCSAIKHQALQALAAQIQLPEPPVPDASALVVFNSLNWERAQVVTLAVDRKNVESWQVYDLEGKKLNTHCDLQSSSQEHQCEVSFLAENIPSVGYRCFWLVPCESNPSKITRDEADSWTLENELLRVQLNEAGDLSSLFDKVNQREVLKASGNQLQAFQDRGQYWDAWNIDPNYANHPLEAAELISIRRSDLTLGTAIAVERKIGQSIFKQTYTLHHKSSVLEIETTVDWKERHVLVKTAFPLNLETDTATYEIPCGAIQRTTRPQTEAEKAQWEVPALHWADLSDGEYGLSLLNDCKYGYDAKPDQLRLTLLRGSEWPDPEADKGQHTFTYAIYPHAGDWKHAQTVRRGYELNQPLQSVLTSEPPSQTRTLPPVGSFLSLGSDHLVLTAFKQSETTSNEWVLRCYECHGEEAQITLTSDLNLKLKEALDGLERSLPKHPQKNQDKSATIRAWQIATFKISAS